ncbi:hypothetical protein DFH08DRAFT_976239 [Mycena albidolilacea]|uniref:Uncharacterized protein n=1 Tax=Mycena albidolilacea TaxID=1033008 RepID=A0AAD6Z2S6_9AGAR|nr:hypothetical protein DFH08DRAFT_976239 [Mycena albidolilacea]
MQPDPQWSDLLQTRLSTTYREFLLLCPEVRMPASSAHRCSASSSSDSGGETSESKAPTPKRRNTSRPRNPHRTHRPEVVKVTDEDDAPTATNDLWNYDFEDEDGRMSSPEPPIVADPHNYDPELEPAPMIGRVPKHA